MEEETIIAVSVLGAVGLLLLVLVAVLFSQLSSMRRRLEDLNNSGRLRVQKLTLENDKNHAFHNPVISPDEELARRGYSMYAGAEDAESGRLAPSERQTGGQFVDELARELDQRQQRRQQSRPPSPPYQPPPHQSQPLVHQNPPSSHQNQPSSHQNQSSLQQNQPSLHQNQSSLHQNQSSLHQNQSSLHRNQSSQHQAPPFLLQSIEDNKLKSRQLFNPVATGGRQSDTNPNFIY